MKKIASGLGALLLSACATPPPSGPGILVLPGSGKSFDQFRFDDQECRGYAHSQVGGKTAEQAANDSAVKSAVIGTAVGAGVGLAGGSLVGADRSYGAAGSLQQRYDHAFTQCMYAKGHRVPVTGRYSDASRPVQQSAARDWCSSLNQAA